MKIRKENNKELSLLLRILTLVIFTCRPTYLILIIKRTNTVDCTKYKVEYYYQYVICCGTSRIVNVQYSNNYSKPCIQESTLYSDSHYYYCRKYSIRIKNSELCFYFIFLFGLRVRVVVWHNMLLSQVGHMSQ